ncbi:putative manganese-dependent inorganic diphosphatase [Clostridium sp. MB40-C1]|uniref:putative manganese-dependent inorganic diphosphatase n=1 Tax=Clostridium sp. MB40-C1 TaxID=3070996 RepID=UPI0027DF7E59|nr:putative manganese-dependent inorganic diphosphatase [Clostridium sp. MB40-C1]WMJ81357.1 putative manganese-dependent inorganic diphosphatase [Clostridium sp. MB40-C1]
MKDIIYVTGHKNPDTDSICSAIAYAEFKNKTQDVEAIPIRLGTVSKETQFALDYFKVKEPKFIDTLKTKVKDLDMDKAAPLSPDVSLKTAWNILKKNNMKTVTVVNGDDTFLGVVSISNLTSAYMDIWDNYILGKSETSYENILDTLSGKAIYYNEKLPNFKGKIIVAAMDPDGIKEVLEEGDIAICGNRIDAQEIIIDGKASLMIVAGNHELDNSIIEKATKQGCSIIATPYDSFTASRMIIQSIPVKYVMTPKDDVIFFKTDEFVEDIKNTMTKTRFRSYPILDANNKAIGAISRFHLISQSNKNVILVDHNERSQSINGLEDAHILEIIDHHRLADIQTGHPIYFRNEPVGCTATIVASMFFENGIRPSKKIAGLLCSAIISDTLLFKSPTSTNMDKLILNRLAKIADINVETYANEMFKAGTSLSGKTVDEIFNQDFKPFTIGDKKIGVGQVSTMDIAGFEPMKEKMLDYMNNKCSSEDYDSLILMLTDIIKDGSQLIVVGEKLDFIEKAFNITLENNTAYVPNLLSRKKQVIPPLTAAVEQE